MPSCSNDDDLIIYLCKENVLLWFLNDFLFLMCSLTGCFDEEEWDRTLLGDLLIKAPHLESLK